MKKNEVVYILSDMIGGMIPKGFKMKYSQSDEVRVGKYHFSWNESECLYLCDEMEGWGYDYEDIFKPHMTFGAKRIDFIFDGLRG